MEFLFYQVEALLQENPHIVSFSVELTPTKSSGKSPCMDGFELWLLLSMMITMITVLMIEIVNKFFLPC